MASANCLERIPNKLDLGSNRQLQRALRECVVEPGNMAGWIASPPRGIDSQPLDYDYVRFAR